MSVGAVTNGTTLGLFTVGILLPWVNEKVFCDLAILVCYLIEMKPFRVLLPVEYHL
jgi:hypothetical protein